MDKYKSRLNKDRGGSNRALIYNFNFRGKAFYLTKIGIKHAITVSEC